MVRTVSDDATRRLEEASVAGESPDKSEQKQSSGETTTSERDPRIAVSHSPSPSGVPSGEDGAKTANGSGAGARTGSGPASGSASGSASAAAASAPGGVDQATAVFRAPRQEDGDSRLRAAVAAWVDQEAEPKDSASEGAASGPEGAAEAEGAKAEDARPGAAEAEADTGTDADADEDGGPESATPKADEAEQAGAKSEAAEDGGTDTQATAPKANDAEPEPATPGTKPEASDNAAVAAAAKADQAKAGGTEADDEDAAPGARATSWGAKPAASEGGGSTPSEPKASPAKAESKASPSEADAKAGPAEAESKAEPSQPKAGPAKADPKADGVSPSEAGAKPTEPAEAKGIDHPTAVFKAPAPPAVDQPTAMLKLPAPKREPADGRTGDPAAERTSQFIPLRSDDAGPGTAAPAKNPAAPAKTPGAPAKGLDAPVRKPEAPKVTPPPAAAPGPAPVIPERAERTRQQPLPPKPPLDLLAELTNTPPPPQTPVRTTVRRFKIWTPLVLLLLIVFAVVQIMRPLPDPKLTLTSSATYTFNGDALNLPWPAEGQSAVSVDGVGSLGTHGEQKPAPLASVAKTMTAYVILKGHPITGKQEGEKITVDQQAEDDAKKPDESTAPIRKDQQFTEKQMLELLMIPSGNNAARLLARWDAGSEEAFIAKMNDAAKELGMTSTTYTDPSGLKETTVSTPVDQLKLAQAVMQNDVFRGIVNTPQIKIPGIDTMIYNNNTILLKPGVSGIKTGSSTPAGGNLLWSADTVVDGKNQRIYGIVMGQRTGTTLDNKLKAAINNSYTLIQAVQKAVTSATVVKKGDVVGYVDDGLGGKTPLVAAKDLKAVGWPGLKVDVTLGSGGKPVPHSAKPGTVVGELSIGSGNGKLTAPVELKSALTEPGTGAKLTRLG
ncbi:serine hydrolase [Streptomyces violascens]|uniref:serine hydrolase n=1 Tax=Streptomyces violascens TaxID=67381 RepID=UPI00367DAEFF